MTNRVTTIDHGKEISVTAPYNPDANKRFRELGGKFNRAAKCWNFPALVKDELKESLLEHYFEDGLTPLRRGIIKIKANHSFGNRFEPIRFAGRILGQAKDRDGGAKISEGVNLLSGALSSGGSRINWETWVAEDSVIAIHDMPESIMELYAENPDRAAPSYYKKADKEEYDDFEILEFIPGEEDEDNEIEQEVEDLEEDEKQGLLQRIADLEARLAEVEGIVAKLAA